MKIAPSTGIPNASTPLPMPSAAPANTPLPLSGKVIFLDPGHGRDADGNYKWGGCVTENDEYVYVEADTVLIYALRTKEALEAQGASVYLTRSDSYMVGNYKRMAQLHIFALQSILDRSASIGTAVDADLQKILSDMLTIYDGYAIGSNRCASDLVYSYFNTPYRNKAAIYPATKKLFDMEALFSDSVLFISLHTNATASATTAHAGTMVYYIDNQTNPQYYANYQEDKNKKLAEALLTYIPQECGLPVQGIAQNDFFMLRENNFPAALVELGYHSNPEERIALLDSSMPEKVANGICLAVCSYFDSIAD